MHLIHLVQHGKLSACARVSHVEKVGHDEGMRRRPLRRMAFPVADEIDVVDGECVVHVLEHLRAVVGHDEARWQNVGAGGSCFAERNRGQTHARTNLAHNFAAEWQNTAQTRLNQAKSRSPQAKPNLVERCCDLGYAHVALGEGRQFQF